MTNSRIRWHLARRDDKKTIALCEKYHVKKEISDSYELEDSHYFRITYHFDNGSRIYACSREQVITLPIFYRVLAYAFEKEK